VVAIIGIVAVDRAGAIGRDGALPWHYAADLKHFKEQTTGNVVVMGRRTWASLKRALPRRLNIVLSGSEAGGAGESVLWVRDRESVLALKDYLRGDLFIIGGAQVFELFGGDIERWVVTEVPLTVEGADTFMPAGFLEGFVVYETRQLEGGLEVKFYRRTSDGDAID
jgi:dihydrofolate reductase